VLKRLVRIASAAVVVVAAGALASSGGSSTRPAKVKNGKIAFVADQGSLSAHVLGRAAPPPAPPPPPPQPDIYTINEDGTGRTRVTTYGTYTYDPAWSPGGRRIAFASTHGTGSYWADIFVINANGTGAVNLTRSAADDRNPAWSPDGRRVAFDSSSGSARDIWVVGADRSDPQQVTYGAGIKVHPSWSPDGVRIVYAAYGTGLGGDLYVVNTRTSRVTRLTNDSSDEFSPAWSPDGSRIAYVGGTAEGYKLFLMNADGSNPRQLYDVSMATGPAWSPDGQKIAFELRPEGKIYVMNVDGTGAHEVTDNVYSYTDQTPSWQPVPVPECVVPRVVGLRLAKARTRIRRARCAVGRVRLAEARRVGRVLRQSPRPGVRRARGTRISLVVGRR
jgi:TolB protein